MPEFVGDPVELRRSKKFLDMRSRASDLFEHGKAFRQANREAKWKQSERQYRGDHWNGMEAEGDQITINMSFSTANTIVPYVTGGQTEFIVEPFSGDAGAAEARLVTSWLNRTWRSSRVEGGQHLEREAHDFLIYGDGYGKQSYEVMDKEIDGEVKEVAQIWTDRLNPWDVYLDPAADGIYNARWVAHRLFIPLSIIRDDPKYKYTEDLGGTGANFRAEETGRPAEALQLETSNHGDTLVEVIEFYDRLNAQLVVFAEGSDMPLRVVDGIECPIVQLGNYIIPNNPYHMGELEQIWELQLELNKTRSQMITHRARNVQKYVAQESALHESAIGALRSSDVNEVILVKGNADPNTVIAPLQVAQLASDAYNISDTITRDIYEISGVNEYLRGATPAISRTATEATLIESASNVKSQHKLRQIEHFVRRVGQQIVNIAAAVFPTTDSEEEAMILTGREAQAVHAAAKQGQPPDQMAQEPPSDQVVDVEFRLSSAIWKGRYEVFVKQHSTELTNPIQKESKYREMFMQLLEAAPAMVALGAQPPNVSAVLELWLEAAGIEDLDKILQPSEGQAAQIAQQQAMAQAAQQQEQLGGIEPIAGIPSAASQGPPLEPITPETSGMMGGEL